MSDRVARLIAVFGAMLASVVIVAATLRVFGSTDPSLQATLVGMLSATLALDIYPRVRQSDTSTKEASATKGIGTSQ